MQAAAALAVRACPAFVTMGRGLPVTYRALAEASSSASPSEHAMQSLVTALAARYDEGGSLIAPDVQSNVPRPAASHITVDPFRLAAATLDYGASSLPGAVPYATPPPLDHVVCFVTHRAAGLSETIECEYIVPWAVLLPEGGGGAARIEEHRIVVAFVDDNGGGEYVPVTMSIDDGPRVALPRSFSHPCIHCGSSSSSSRLRLHWVDGDDGGDPRWLPTRVVIFTAPFVQFHGHLSQLRSWFRRLPRAVSLVRDDQESSTTDLPMEDALILFFRGSFVMRTEQHGHSLIGGPVFSHIASARQRMLATGPSHTGKTERPPPQEEEGGRIEEEEEPAPAAAATAEGNALLLACCAGVFIIVVTGAVLAKWWANLI